MSACMRMHVCRGKREQRAGWGLQGLRASLRWTSPISALRVSPAFTTERRAGSGQAGPGSGPQGANDQLARGVLVALGLPWVSRPLG